MNIYQNDFKTDIFEGIKDLSFKIFKPSMVIYLIYFAVAMVFSLIFVRLLGFSNLGDLMSLNQALDPEQSIEMYENLAAQFSNPTMIIGFVIMVLFMIVVASWMQYTLFLIANEEVKHQSVEINSILSESINIKVVYLILILIGFVIAFALGFGLLGFLLGMISPVLALVLIPLYFYVAFKLFLFFPAYILGELSIKEAIQFSFKHITGIRILKLIGIGIVVFVALLVISLIVGIPSMLLASVPVVGTLISALTNFITGILFSIFFVAGCTALYYRYAPALDSEDDFEITDHLVEN